MPRRILIAALLSWGTLAIPSLCSAGMLEHFCECGVSSSCPHEEDCSTDPCVIAKPAAESTGPVQPLAPTPVLANIFRAGVFIDPTTFSSWRFAGPPTFATSPALRAGTRPLLI